jgi:transmembrane sensor
MSQEHQEQAWNLIAKKLSGEATPEELQELELLLRSNPDLHYPMQTVSEIWNQAAPDDRQAAEQAFDRHLERMQELKTDFHPQQPLAATPDMNTYSFPRNRSKTTRRIIIAGSAFIAATVLGIIFAVYLSPLIRTPTGDHQTGATKVNSEISTHNGSKTHLVLPDGTLVWLNAGSRITYDKNYGVTHREISLIGEAFFDVVHNAERPFVIHTAKIDIKVLGTRFNVKSYPLDKTTEATLVRGSIEVSIKARPDEKIILKPNEKLVVANDDSTLQRKSPGRLADINESLVNIRKPTYESGTGAIIETSWVDNKLIFQDEEFGELAIKMERWYGVTIQFNDPELAQWRFTGAFQNETIQQALDALTLTADFTYKMEGSKIAIEKK